MKRRLARDVVFGPGIVAAKKGDEVEAGRAQHCPWGLNEVYVTLPNGMTAMVSQKDLEPEEHTGKAYTQPEGGGA